MVTTWTAAAALMAGTRSLEYEAVALLDANRDLASRFGHQATVTKLLRMTPELNLYPLLRSRFIRRALYENTFQKL